MTKKDYELIANRIRKTKLTYSQGGTIDAWYCIQDIALALSEVLEKENPRFKKDLFIKTCGFEQGKNDILHTTYKNRVIAR